MSVVNMHYDDVLRAQVAQLESKNGEGTGAEVDQLREQVRKLREENESLRQRLSQHEVV